LEESFSIGREKVPKGMTRKTRPGDVTTKKLRVVCKSCNNGWMGAIETRAKPGLSAMIRGAPISLSRDLQTKIATWVALKVLVSEHTAPKDVITSKTDSHAFRAQMNPPNGMFIFAASCGDSHWKSAYFRTSATAGSSPLDRPPIKSDGTYPKNTHFISFGIGSAFFFVFYTTNNSIEPDFGFSPTFIRQIWPITHSPVLWPPMRRITSIEANTFATSFAGFRDAPGVNWIDD
jgi:hypothetical protein